MFLLQKLKPQSKSNNAISHNQPATRWTKWRPLNSRAYIYNIYIHIYTIRCYSNSVAVIIKTHALSLDEDSRTAASRSQRSFYVRSHTAPYSRQPVGGRGAHLPFHGRLNPWVEVNVSRLGCMASDDARLLSELTPVPGHTACERLD